MNSLSQLNLQIPDLWEVKDVINKVKNVVLNYTEMEAKVHEATNNEPWGASSTLMQEIAQGTYNYQYFNEIMPTLYKRFTEKEAKQWRQIYKALVLLEYLVKNGSERVIDDARSHLPTIKMLRNFHYIDDKGKDQGINVRNRAKELGELINNTDKIRAERKKARQNRNKYTGVGSESTFGMGGVGSGSGSRFGGFGSETVGSMSIRADGGFGDNATSGYYDDEGRHNRYRSSKYDDFNDLPAPQNDSGSPSKSTKKAVTAKELNLFDFGDDSASSASASKPNADDEWGDFTAGGIASETVTSDKLDDFDDFQTAPVSTSGTTSGATAAASTTATKTAANDLFDLFGNDTFSSPTPATQPIAPAQSIFTSSSNGTNSALPSPVIPSQPRTANTNVKPADTPNTGKKQDLPSGMWSQASAFVSLDSLGKSSTPTKPSTGPSINTLKTSSVHAGWSTWAASNQAAPTVQAKPQLQPAQQKQNFSFDDLLS